MAGCINTQTLQNQNIYTPHMIVYSSYFMVGPIYGGILSKIAYVILGDIGAENVLLRLSE